MGTVNWTTLIAFIGTLAAIVTLTVSGHTVPAAISGVLGSLITAILPELMGKGSSPKPGDGQ